VILRRAMLLRDGFQLQHAGSFWSIGCMGCGRRARATRAYDRAGLYRPATNSAGTRSR